MHGQKGLVPLFLEGAVERRHRAERVAVVETSKRTFGLRGGSPPKPSTP